MLFARAPGARDHSGASANMPAMLLELGYLTNPDQEKLIASDAYQNAIVSSLVEAVVRFRDTFANAGAGTR